MYCVVDKIKVSIGAAKVKALAWEFLSPKWRAFTNNFPLSVEQCQIFNKHWVEIVPASPDINVISAGFYKPNPKAPNTPIFKTGKYRIDLCIPWTIYTAFEGHELEQQATASNANNDSDEEMVCLVVHLRCCLIVSQRLVDRTTADSAKARSVRSSDSPHSTKPGPEAQSTRPTPASSGRCTRSTTRARANAQDSRPSDEHEQGAGLCSNI
jgi:hypothetical protein